MEQILSFIAFLLASDQVAIYLTVWGLLAVVLTVALVLRRITLHMAAIEEAKRQHRIEARLGDETAEAERAEAERALERLQANAANNGGQRTAKDFIPYGYSDHAA